ncbi:hypothetical protein [Sphingomonas baiyangensis]|uniref:hypothetical protein n=1 Tax=Sphingomonas baiyangensis TaxID=2572576 RepID=UPI00146D02D1|nr:hypothetical protein [Sphingomonas baiyangensis]
MRDIDAPGELAEIEARALLNWTKRENGFPAFTRLRWADGTLSARIVAMQKAARELGYL